MKHLSDVGKKLSDDSKTYEMMKDLGAAASRDKDMVLMGGGHPASIPEVNEIWRKRLKEIMDDKPGFDRFISKYYMPVGKDPFLINLAKFFNDLYGWNITENNIAISNGSQTSYFVLFNLLAGTYQDEVKKILFPMTPEYVGYADQALHPEMFTTQKSIIDITGKHTFKYRLDFDNLKLTKETAAVCVSRPCNPSGNVLTDEEVKKLHQLAKQNGSYLILDLAYAGPFPNIMYKDINTFWDEDVILTYSLSKLGLPSARTGIIIANEEIIDRFRTANLALSLSIGGMGPTITSPLFGSNKMLDICNNIINPYYVDRCKKTQEFIQKHFDDDIDYYIHEPEGAFFIWLWLKDKPVDMELFKNLVDRGVLCVPGSYFFGLYEEPWQHRNECLRITYCLEDEPLERAIKIIGEEVKKFYK